MTETFSSFQDMLDSLKDMKPQEERDLAFWREMDRLQQSQKTTEDGKA